MVYPRSAAKIESKDTTLRLAVLIDADNLQADIIEGLFTEIERFGQSTVRRIYRDFTTPTSSAFEKVLQQYTIEPVQHLAYTTGKNTLDSMLIIDAMDLLYTRQFDGFCLVSSDNSFTRLAMRLREEGLIVFGFGEKKTPETFRNACHKFLYTEVLQPDITPKINQETSAVLTQNETSVQKSKFLEKFVLSALDQISDDTDWTHLDTLESYLTKLQPDFDARIYGFKELSEIVKQKTDFFETEERKVPGSDKKNLYLRAKKPYG